MKNTGVNRRVDDLGRVVIPKEIRRILDIGERDTLIISISKDTIVIQKYHTSCVFCRATEELIDFKDKPVCTSCLKDCRSPLKEAEQTCKPMLNQSLTVKVASGDTELQ